MWTPCPNINHMTPPLMERAQPPFGTIYNLLQDELVARHEYTLMKTLSKGSFDIQSFQLIPLSSFLKRKMVICECVLIIMN